MNQNTEGIETIRRRYRPKHVITLFVGESAPKSGKFFYCGNTALKRYMQKAMQAAGLVGNGDFLECFKAYGWYLDDLVLTPVDKLPNSEREAKCLSAQKTLADRIACCRPLAIVPLLVRIRKIVKDAADDAGCTARHYPVPFPGNGHQTRFLNEMACILPKLPKIIGSN